MRIIKRLVTWLLNLAVRQHIKRNGIQVIAVAGSIGKTSTANAIRVVMSQRYRVHQPATAYNTDKSVHLEMFDLEYATSLVGWARQCTRILLRSLGRSQYEVLVIEIGTDHPGDLRQFAWLQPDMGVLTAIAPEHMEYFQTIEAVAKEELVIAEFCRRLLCNTNAVDRHLVSGEVAERAQWYGTGTDYDASNYSLRDGTARADFKCGAEVLQAVTVQVIGVHSLNALVAAMAVAAKYDLTMAEIEAGLQAVKPVRGRMRLLSGTKSSAIIDDSYNASPDAVKAALDVLYSLDAPQRIAVLGSMNEMGEYSERAHREVGEYCDPKKLDLVLTVGSDANRYLAPAAERRGCEVQCFLSPYQAGSYLKEQLKTGAMILFKGSQNGVFVEEAIKSVLADKADQTALVRQSDFWLRRKAEQFPDVDR